MPRWRIGPFRAFLKKDSTGRVACIRLGSLGSRPACWLSLITGLGGETGERIYSLRFPNNHQDVKKTRIEKKEWGLLYLRQAFASVHRAPCVLWTLKITSCECWARRVLSGIEESQSSVCVGRWTMNNSISLARRVMRGASVSVQHQHVFF